MTVLRRLCLGLTLCCAACQSSLGNGIAHYGRAEYPEALVAFERARPELSDAEEPEVARYALYRGLTHLALGNAPLARPWLVRVRRALARDVTLLGADDRGRLHAAWRSMGHMPGDSPSD